MSEAHCTAPNEENKDDSAPYKSRKLRLSISVLIIALTLVSLVLLQIHRELFWIYTWIMCVFIALACVTLGGYLLNCNHAKTKLSLWRTILYWAGFLAALYIDALMLHYGVSTATQSGLFALILLAASLYFLGITHDFTFAIVGFTIAIMLIGALMIHNYLLLVLTPIAIIMSFLVFLLLKKNKPHSEDSSL